MGIATTITCDRCGVQKDVYSRDEIPYAWTNIQEYPVYGTICQECSKDFKRFKAEYIQKLWGFLRNEQ